MKPIIIFSSSDLSEDEEIPNLQVKTDVNPISDKGNQTQNRNSPSSSASSDDIVAINSKASKSIRTPSKNTNQDQNSNNQISAPNDLDSKEKNKETQIENENSDSDEDNSDDVTLPLITLNEDKPFSSTTFAISRKKRKTIRGTRYFYYFYSNANPIFCAKAKSRHPTQYVPICEGTNVRMKGESQYTLLINDNVFLLKRGGSTGEELLSINLFIDSTLMILPTHVDVQTKPALGIPPLSLTTKVPKMGASGMSRLDFHNKFAIPSEKNMIFVQNSDPPGPDLLIVRKISKDGMEIDLCTDLPNSVVFAIGLAIFVAKFH